MLSRDIRDKTREALANMCPFNLGCCVRINEVSSLADKVTVKGLFRSNILALLRNFEITFDASNNLTELKITPQGEQM